MANLRNLLHVIKGHLKFSQVLFHTCLLGGIFIQSGCSPCRDCEPPQPETPVYPSVTTSPKIYSYTRGYSWSAVAYTDVTLAEIHTSISDFELSSNPPRGYSLRLKKVSHKDEAGYNIYRIVCDMEAITETTSSNENVKVEIPYTLTGTYMSGGKIEVKEVKNSVSLQRFLAPDKEAENNFFPNFWYLSEYTVYSNVEWVNFTSEESYTEEKTSPYSYSFDLSPIRRNRITKELVIMNEWGEYETNINMRMCGNAISLSPVGLIQRSSTVYLTMS